MKAGWHIMKDIKPIPNRSFDWGFYHDDYDGENGLCGTASSVKDALEQIDEIESEDLEQC
jgi:hypothetical protein